MPDTFAVDLAAGSNFTLPKYFIGGKFVNFSGEAAAYDTLQGFAAPHTADGKTMKTLLREAVPDFLSWSSIGAARFDGYDPNDINDQQWRSLLDASLAIVADGGGIAPGFVAHGITAPLVMGSYAGAAGGSGVTYPPELVTNVPDSANAYSREQAGKWLLAILNGGGPAGSPLSTSLGGDASRFVGVEIGNEPATNNPQQYGEKTGTQSFAGSQSWPAGKGWYNDPNTQGTLEERFHTNILPYYHDYFVGLPGLSGLKVQGYSYSLGALAGPNEIASLTEFVNCYSGSRQWQASSGSKNLTHFELLALHGYTQISTGGIAGANVNDPQQVWNTLFHTTVPYDITKDGYVGGLRAKRTLFNSLGGVGVSFHFSEQWFIDGSGASRNSTQAKADILGFIATVQNASSWFPNGGGYAVHCVNPCQIVGSFDPQTSYPSVNDFMFGYQNSSGQYVLHRTGRYYAWKHFMCKFGNRNGYQRLLPVTQSSSNTPATVLNNAVPRIQGVAGLKSDGSEMAFLVSNTDTLNPSTVTFSWTGSHASAPVYGEIMLNGSSLPLNTAPTPLTNLAAVGASSFSYTLPASADAIFFVPVSGVVSAPSLPANTQLPAIAGPTVVGSTLTADVGLFSNGPYTTALQWYLCDPNGANPVATGTFTSTYLIGAGAAGDTLRIGVTATNPSGDSSIVYSLPTGVVTAAGGGGGSGAPMLSGSALEVTNYANTYSGTITAPTLTSGILVFHYHGKTSDDVLTVAPTWNGANLTKLKSQTDGGTSIFTEVWYKLAPTAGAHLLAWSKPGLAQNIGHGVTFWEGVDQTNPFGSTPLVVGSGSHSTQAISDSLLAAVGDVVVSVGTFNIAAATPTHGSGQTDLYADHQSTTQLAASYKTVAAPGSVAVSESASAGAANAAHVAYVLRGIPTGAVPVNSQSPVLSGPAVEQQQLDCTTGAWNDPSATYTYRYEKATPGTPPTAITSIRSASATSTYTIAVGVSTKLVRCVVIATNATGSSEAPSQWSEVVISPGLTTAPVATANPVASGIPSVGQTAVCTTGLYEASHPPTSYTYEVRYVSDDTVVGASSSYKFKNEDAGESIYWFIVPTNSYGDGTGVSSNAIGPIIGMAPASLSAPVVTSVTVGTVITLTGTDGGWQDATLPFAYRWTVDGADAGNTTNELVTTTSDTRVYALFVTAGNDSGTTECESNVVIPGHLLGPPSNRDSGDVGYAKMIAAGYSVEAATKIRDALYAENG